MSADLHPSTLELVPEGIDPPEGIPPEVFSSALATFLEGRRLDMQALAADLDMSRSTLYRRVGDRDSLLGSVVWYLTRRALVPILEETRSLAGADRIVEATRRFMHFVHDQPAFRRLLAEEPEAALRVLTSKDGFVQGALVALNVRAIEQEEAAGNLAVGFDHETLAYAIVRIAESFLYADVIARNDLDLDAAAELIGRLLGGSSADH
jgi:AcrR family transcriptional regulator